MVIRDIFVSSFAEHCTGTNHQPRCETKELRTECRQTVEPSSWKCPTQVNRNRYPSCHALRDECRLRRRARSENKARQHTGRATLPQKYTRIQTATCHNGVLLPSKIWTPSAVATTCSHTHTLFQLLYRYTEGNIRRARTRNLKRSTRHKNQNAQNTKTMSSCLKLCELATRGRNDTQCITSAHVQLEKHSTVPCIHVLLNDTREDSTVNAKCAKRCKHQMHLAFHDMCNSEECASD